jgi:ABC-type multidrug transport system fused ATPase/permease subunit
MILNLISKKINHKIIELKETSLLCLIIFLSLISIILEGLSISTIPLFFKSLFTDLEINNTLINSLLKYSSEIVPNNITNVFLFVIFLFFFKSIFSFFLITIEFIFLKRLRLKISNILIEKFINSDLMNNYKESSATKIWKIELVNNFSYAILNLISFIKNSLYLLIILFSIVYFSSNNFAIFFIIILLLIIIFYNFFKKKIVNTGKNISILTESKNNIIQNIFEGIKTILIFQKKNFFKNLFNDITVKIEKNQQTINYISAFTLVFLDFFAILIIFFYYQLFLTGNSSEYLVYNLGLISYGLMRVISILKILNQSFYNIKRNSYSINILLKELDENKLTIKSKFSQFYEKNNNKNIIEINNLRFNYNFKKTIFDELSFNFKRNYFYGIFGESGSGKSTLLDLILGINHFNEGKINVYCSRKKVSYVPQECFIMQENIKNSIAFGEHENQINLNRIQESIEKSQLSSFINKLPSGINFQLNKNGNNISVGQKQRIGIARSLYISSGLLIMDEPTSALDKKTEIDFFKMLKNIKKDVTVIMTTHKLSLKKFFDTSLIIKNKKISKF